MLILTLILPTVVLADGPKDNIPDNVRRIPRLGIEVSDADRKELEAGLETLGAAIEDLKKSKSKMVSDLLPDVQVYHRGVWSALHYQEFFAKPEVGRAKELLKTGIQRATDLKAGKAPWTTATGLVVRGYRSKIDHTVQPYGLVIPASYASTGVDNLRLDLWFHGRGETLSEVKFIDGRSRQVGQYAPKDTFVLHPYGRYSNAFKFAGEVDVLEALDAVQRHYRIDEDRISVRGFSMGGAACWQFAVHYADRWFAANPGAGFSETPEFLKFFQKETLNPTWYEQKLWNLYDCNRYAINLFHCPTVAYSGELDIQKQAADIMESALEEQGIDLVHIIGPQTKHSIHPQSKVEIERRLAGLARRGRERVPKNIHLQTYTLKYNRMAWVTIDAMGEHWERARVDTEILDANNIVMKTENVTELTLSMAPGWCPLDMTKAPNLKIDFQPLQCPRPKSDRSWTCRLYKTGDTWRVGTRQHKTLRKRRDLQGPIDDAFMDSFIFVKPSGQSDNELVEKWTRSELAHAIEHWRRQFRGEARVKSDAEITDADIASSNLVLFGDCKSNSVLGKLADRLPISWTDATIEVGDSKYSAKDHAVVLIYPNPLNPNRYVVLNSGFTYREFAYLNNARQVSMLPDWAVIDLKTPATSQFPGKRVNAGFFGESWELKK
ncbi:MAG: hypothetical protein CMJ78_01820 [Planctomycetaceae bacterium]|nr:hypothetical protein [Planctomycetaceae bacterium]